MKTSTKKGAATTLGALVLGAAALAACGGPVAHAATVVTTNQSVRCQNGMPTVTEQGYGSVEGTPDQMTISLGVQNQSATAGAAIRANNAKAQALITTLEADGVAKADLQTSQLSVQPNYNNNGTAITSYEVTNTITLTLNDLARAGAIIDDAAQVAGNSVRVDNIQFAVRNETPLLGEARAAAVKQAASQADVLAVAAGMTLGPLCSLRDDTTPTQPPPVYGGFAPTAQRASTPVEAGSEQVTANVTAVYQLNAGSPAPAGGTSTSTTSATGGT